MSGYTANGPSEIEGGDLRNEGSLKCATRVPLPVKAAGTEAPFDPIG
jgi:hypothetical protein